MAESILNESVAHGETCSVFDERLREVLYSFEFDIIEVCKEHRHVKGS